jgi:hypothetical protein
MRELRRKDRAMDNDEALELIQAGEYGFLATAGEDGQPYGVPLNYVFQKNSIYFHSAKA